MISLTVIMPSPFASPTGHVETGAVPKAMFTMTISSLTVTTLSPLQSPPQRTAVGVGDGVIVWVSVGVLGGVDATAVSVGVPVLVGEAVAVGVVDVVAVSVTDGVGVLEAVEVLNGVAVADGGAVGVAVPVGVGGIGVVGVSDRVGVAVVLIRNGVWAKVGNGVFWPGAIDLYAKSTSAMAPRSWIVSVPCGIPATYSVT